MSTSGTFGALPPACLGGSNVGGSTISGITGPGWGRRRLLGLPAVRKLLQWATGNQWAAPTTVANPWNTAVPATGATSSFMIAAGAQIECLFNITAGELPAGRCCLSSNPLLSLVVGRSIVQTKHTKHARLIEGVHLYTTLPLNHVRHDCWTMFSTPPSTEGSKQLLCQHTKTPGHLRRIRSLTLALVDQHNTAVARSWQPRLFLAVRTLVFYLQFVMVCRHRGCAPRPGVCAGHHHQQLRDLNRQHSHQQQRPG
jgi:hypothetical protein